MTSSMQRRRGARYEKVVAADAVAHFRHDNRDHYLRESDFARALELSRGCGGGGHVWRTGFGGRIDRMSYRDESASDLHKVAQLSVQKAASSRKGFRLAATFCRAKPSSELLSETRLLVIELGDRCGICPRLDGPSPQ